MSAMTDAPVALPWPHLALCKGAPDSIFFHDKDSPRDNYGPARKMCSACPVTMECLTAVMEREEGVIAQHRHGFCGGLTPVGRAGLARENYSQDARLEKIAAQRKRQVDTQRARRAAARLERAA